MKRSFPLFANKIWIPIVFILIGVAIGSTFWGRHIASQEPVKVFTAVTPEPASESMKLPHSSETAESGDDYVDEWDAEAAESGDDYVDEWDVEHSEFLEVPDAPAEQPRGVDLEVYETSLSHLTAEQRARYDRVLNNYIARHYNKYPDSQNHEAVWEDADRLARWYVEEHKPYWEKYWAASDEVKKVTAEYNEFFDEYYLNRSAEERRQYHNNMSDAEKESLKVYLIDLRKRINIAWEKAEEVREGRPPMPTPRYTP
ncbi:hypothetical protein F4054_23075 [Candidatus Poribacteria bacterium]|nr:hypothetical protein [Candidatus Poribacteria bacterium]MYG08580.1 hypothetical protein [Candidatus Poribacteria bacterium]MYK25136.1 hypothetical protein [Candidatus Poribacteria bacterium]